MEKSLKGGKDSFTETLRTDTALVRKRIANPALKIKSTLLGRKSLTRAAILYVDGVADPAVVTELTRRIDNIDVDGALSTGVIEEYITDRPRSVFPQVVHTERPDRFARQLLNGRVGLLIDGIPIAFLVPVTFPELLRVPQEDSQNYIVSSALSVIRWAAVLLALRILKKKNAPKVWSRILIALTAVSMAVIFGAMGYISVQGKDSAMTPDETPDFIVVLGAQVQGDGPSLTLKKRLDKALELGADDYMVKLHAVPCGARLVPGAAQHLAH